MMSPCQFNVSRALLQPRAISANRQLRARNTDPEREHGMQALVLKQPGKAAIETVEEIFPNEGEILLKVKRVGLCGSDLNSYRGKNPLIKFPRILGHEIAATVVHDTPGFPDLTAGTDVTLSPYTSCGRCSACKRNRPNACQYNETRGVQRDGALTE